MKNILLRTWLATILSFLGIFSPVAKATLPEPALMHPAVTATRAVSVKPVIQQNITGMNLHANEKAYSYVFTGKALENGQPSAGGRIIVQVISKDSVLTLETLSGADGSYNLTVPVIGQPSESVRWEIIALTPDMKRGAAEGHQILMDESTIQQNSLLSVF